MTVRITCVGALTGSLPEGFAEIGAEGLTVREALHLLVQEKGEPLQSELLDQGEYKRGLSFLLNGRNVLSLPEKHDTLLKGGDELIIAAILAGG